MWLLASRLGANPLGFTEPIILLTAIHFHFAGFAAPIIAGLVGRELAKPKSFGRETSWISMGYPIVAVIIILGPTLVAVGITFSPIMEAVAGVALAVGYTGLAS
ncbi:MAG: YndJ family transporter [Anaerolineae bacterium]|nr:YndJ family transporter [Anaerolineae bacterium]